MEKMEGMERKMKIRLKLEKKRSKKKMERKKTLRVLFKAALCSFIIW